jgi:hypothetical protein
MMMNERIKELWEKAAQAAAAYPSGQNNSWETQVNFMEKFAELIVRECANIADEPTSRPFDSYGKKIKKHFGIE